MRYSTHSADAWPLHHLSSRYLLRLAQPVSDPAGPTSVVVQVPSPIYRSRQLFRIQRCPEHSGCHFEVRVHGLRHEFAPTNLRAAAFALHTMRLCLLVHISCEKKMPSDQFHPPLRSLEFFQPPG